MGVHRQIIGCDIGKGGSRCLIPDPMPLIPLRQGALYVVLALQLPPRNFRIETTEEYFIRPSLPFRMEVHESPLGAGSIFVDSFMVRHDFVRSSLIGCVYQVDVPPVSCREVLIVLFKNRIDYVP